MDPNLREIFLSILEQIIKIWIYFDSQHLSQTHLLLKSLPRLVLSLWSSEFLLYITHNFDAPSGSCYRIGDPACLGASLKIRSPTLRFSMLYTYPPYVRAETLSPKENSCLLGRTRIRGCKVFSSRQQPGAWIFSGYSLFQPFQLTNERSIAVSLHVTRNQDLFAYLPLTIKLSCLKHFWGFFFSPDYEDVEWLPNYFTFIQLVRWIVLLVCFQSHIVAGCFSQSGCQHLQTGSAAGLARCWLLLPTEVSQGQHYAFQKHALNSDF